MTASSSCTPLATRCRRSTPSPATCCGSTRAGCRWGATPSVKRSIALYGDKVYTRHLRRPRRRARRQDGRVVWDKQIADRTKGFGLTGGVTVAKGKVIAEHHRPRPRRQLHRRPRRQHGREAWRFNTIPKESEPGGNTLERRAVREAQRRFGVDAGQLRPGAATSSTSASRRPTTPVRYRNLAPGTEQRLALHRLDGRAEPGHRQAGRGTSSTSPTISGTTTGRSAACCSTCSPTARPLVAHRRQAGDLRLRGGRHGQVRVLDRSRRAGRRHRHRPGDGRQADQPAADSWRRRHDHHVPARRRRQDRGSRSPYNPDTKCCSCRSSRRAWT